MLAGFYLARKVDVAKKVHKKMIDAEVAPNINTYQRNARWTLQEHVYREAYL